MSKSRLLTSLALTLAAGCAQKLPATGCHSDGQCAADARCISGTCTADARPTAAVRPVGAVQEFDLVRLDGSQSADADGDLAEHVWTVLAVDAPCDPPAVSGRTPVAFVRFGCAGRYEVALSVRDALGIESEPARTEVVVQPSSAAPVVLAGPDASTDHLCGGTPLTCRTSKAIALTAEADPGLALRWTVMPPVDRALDATRRVRFLPDDASPAPRAEIVTDGTAISGDWIFRVEALDAYGVVGAAFTRVSVGNRPPVVTFAPAGPFEHAFDATRSVFTSQGAVAWRVVDPDGDPVEVQGIWRHLGDGELSLFDGDFDATAVTFAVEVPYEAPQDALRLRGGADLLREIELVAVDANRQVGRGAFAVEIGNRPPVPAGGTFDATVPHRFDPQRSMYVASVRAGAFVDPDGDPLVDSSGGPAPCGAIHVSGQDVTVECAVPFAGVPALDQLVGVRRFPVAAHDPWDAAVSIPVHTVTIGNSPPVVTATPSPATKCVLPSGSVFVALGLEPNPLVPFDVAPQVADPDGDPVQLRPIAAQGGSASPGAAVCTAECVTFRFMELRYTQQQVWSAPFAFLNTGSFLDASDGVARALVPVSPAWREASSCP